MKKVAALLVLLCASVVAVAAADRIFTNPTPEGHFKKLFPQAVAFSGLQGTPLHYNAYAVDPKKDPTAKPIGYIFWTTDMVPNEHGYHGAIHMLVGLNLNGTINAVVVDYNSEPYGYFSVDPPEFAEQRGLLVGAPGADGQPPAGVERAAQLARRGRPVGEELEPLLADDDVEPLAVAERERAGVALAPVDVGGDRPRDGEHGGAEVDAHDRAPLPHALLREPRDDARPAGDVEHAVARADA